MERVSEERFGSYTPEPLRAVPAYASVYSVSGFIMIVLIFLGVAIPKVFWSSLLSAYLVSHAGLTSSLVFTSKRVSLGERGLNRVLALAYGVLGLIPLLAWIVGGYICHRVNLTLSERGCAPKRNTLRYAALTVLTVGLYQPYWWYVTVKDIERCFYERT